MMDFDYEKYRDGSYNFIVNKDGDLAIVRGAGKSEVDANIAKIIFDESEEKAILVRNKNSLVFFEELSPEICEMFKDGRTTITVIEVKDENTEPNSYEVPIEIKNELGNDAYEGDLVDGKPHGKGKYTWLNGDVYEGDFVEGKFHGKGKMITANGDVYEGDFLDDNFHGQGKMALADGTIYNGNWENGNFVQ